MRFPYKTLIAVIGLIFLFIGIHLHINKPFSTLSEEAFISPSHESIKFETQLYFVFDQALYPERRRVEVIDGQYEEAVLEALIQGSTIDHFSSIFDYNFDIINIEIVNNTCYVNFSEPVTLSTLWSDESFDLYVWSLVNSLTELKRVVKVQLMVEGQPMEHPYSSHNLSEPLSRDESYIYSKERVPADAAIDFFDYIVASRFDLSYALLTAESKSDYNYTAFINYADELKSEIETYSYLSHFTKIKDPYWEVHLKFVREYISDGFQQDLYKKVTILQEDGVFRIQLTED